MASFPVLPFTGSAPGSANGASKALNANPAAKPEMGRKGQRSLGARKPTKSGGQLGKSSTLSESLSRLRLKGATK